MPDHLQYLFHGCHIHIVFTVCVLKSVICKLKRLQNNNSILWIDITLIYQYWRIGTDFYPHLVMKIDKIKLFAEKNFLNNLLHDTDFFITFFSLPESKNRRPHLSLWDIILRLKRGKRGSSRSKRFLSVKGGWKIKKRG